MEEFVLPGDILGPASALSQSDGLYTDSNFLFASKCGITKKSPDDSKKLIAFNTAQKCHPDAFRHFESITIGSLVICKAKSLTDTQCKVDIICTHGKPLAAPYKGVIYVEHIRSSFNKDFTKAYHSFQLNDIILARVIGVFDNRNSRERVLFLLSTAEKELGVILAKSPNDKSSFLIPTSWREMICPATHQRYRRKVAKVMVHAEECTV